jgi:YggT family protein
VAYDIVDKTIWVMTILIFVRVISSWVPLLFGPFSPITAFFTRSPFSEFVFTVTEPVLAPIRSVMPRGMMIDLSPMIAIFLLQIVGNIILSNLN